MKYASSLVTALTVSVLGFLAVPAQAAPAPGMGELKPMAGQEVDVEQVRYRRCYWHRGHWHCPRYRRYYGPGIHFHYGPRRHYHRHHRHHRRHWRY
jgi:hypothetical protein